jgi:hypothetical protein
VRKARIRLVIAVAFGARSDGTSASATKRSPKVPPAGDPVAAISLVKAVQGVDERVAPEGNRSADGRFDEGSWSRPALQA